MIRKLRNLEGRAKRIIANLAKVCVNGSIEAPSFASMTLDQDDAVLARNLLEDRSGSEDQGVVGRYEVEFARWNASKCAFAFMGGRIALSACIYALGLKPGDEVILPGYTCVVVPNAFHFAGVKTVYSDIELDTYGLDASQIARNITSNTKALMLHHLYGLVCRDYLEIIDIARSHGLYVIEDCAQAIGAEFRGVKVGNLGDIAFYSTEHTKVFSTIQGGLATTNDSRLGERLREYYESSPSPSKDQVRRQLRNVLLEYYQFKAPQRWWRAELADMKYGKDRLVGITDDEKDGNRPSSHGCRMAGPIAALGISQLKKVDRYNETRRETAKTWDEWCDCHYCRRPAVTPDSSPVYLRYPVMVEPQRKQDTSWAYRELGVKLGVWFVGNIHPTDKRIAGCPNADRAVRQCVNFPTLLR